MIVRKYFLKKKKQIRHPQPIKKIADFPPLELKSKENTQWPKVDKDVNGEYIMK